MQDITLFEYDRMAPIETTATRYSWEEAKAIVLKAYGAFSPQMEKIAQMFFDQNWIDAATGEAKRGGAYSHSTVPSAHPYVFMNFTGTPRDVMTLAHELGHGIHQYLYREQGVFHGHTPLTMAETASVFGEHLTFQSLVADAKTKKEKLTLLCRKIEDSIATIFRQISMNRFEDAAHTHKREKGELSTLQLDELWRSTQTELYGDSIVLRPEYDRWWCYIPHFLHSPGYVYAYAFGDLLVLSLVGLYKEIGQDAFVPLYLDLLKAGGSASPDQLLAPFNINLNDEQFWNHGLQLLQDILDEAIEIANSI